MHLQDQIDSLQAQRASEWLEILRAGRPEDLAEFRAWCRKSPLHIAAFLEITWTEVSLAELQSMRTEDVETLISKLSAGVTPFPSRVPEKAVGHALVRSRRARLWPLGAAALVATIAVGIAFHFRSSPAEHLSTSVGEQRTVQLLDTSVVTINTDSQLDIQFEPDVRSVELLQGEATFRVAHDPARPFRVHTRAGTVQALGTQFNVYDRAEGTDVTVLEGLVRLTASGQPSDATAQVIELAAGEEARIGLDGSISRSARADLERVTAWATRRLKFDQATLEEMVHEFNRYNIRPRLRLEGVTGVRHYSGIFEANKPDTLARFLEQEVDLQVDRSEDEITIHPRP